MHSNSSKPYQAQLIARAGFDVPATLVTNDPDAVRDFAAEHGALVYKSTSGIRSIVRRLDAAALARLERVRSLPTQFQAVVDGTDVRVHVVGERVFATEVRSQAVDYRYAARDGLDAELVATDVPDDVAQRCVRLAGELGLALAGVDLRRTPDGRWACFEVNPMPGYSFYESHTGQPISRALVAHLAGEAD
jgi:glutathione synthase/RimK-type ligase-like ATP-grasp enzyme